MSFDDPCNRAWLPEMAMKPGKPLMEPRVSFWAGDHDVGTLAAFGDTLQRWAAVDMLG